MLQGKKNKETKKLLTDTNLITDAHLGISRGILQPLYHFALFGTLSLELILKSAPICIPPLSSMFVLLDYSWPDSI